MDNSTWVIEMSRGETQPPAALELVCVSRSVDLLFIKGNSWEDVTLEKIFLALSQQWRRCTSINNTIDNGLCQLQVEEGTIWLKHTERKGTRRELR